MKTTLKLKRSSLIIAEQPWLTAMTVIFFSAVFMMALLAVFQDHALILKVARYAFWTLFALAVAHFAVTKLLVTRFSRKQNRIPLLFYDSHSRIYQHPVFKKIPYAEIIFPENWNVERAVGTFITPLFFGVKTSNQATFMLVFNLQLETFGSFKAQDLEKLIAFQRTNNPLQKKFDAISCLEDFLINDCLRNHHSIKYLLEDYHLGQISFQHLENGILQMVKIPPIFTNVVKIELKLSEAQKIIKLGSTVKLSLFDRAVAAIL